MLRFDPVTRDQTYTIGEFSARYGVSLRALRFYEERELLCPRRYGRLRLYTEDDKTRLEIILKAKRLGFSLAAIWELLAARGSMASGKPCDPDNLGLTKSEIEEQLAKLTQKRACVSSAIEELQIIMGKPAK